MGREKFEIVGEGTLSSQPRLKLSKLIEGSTRNDAYEAGGMVMVVDRKAGIRSRCWKVWPSHRIGEKES